MENSVLTGQLVCEDANAVVLYSCRCLERFKKQGCSIPEAVLDLASQYTMSADERLAIATIVGSQWFWLRDSLFLPNRAMFHYFWGWPTQPTKENTSDDHP